MTLEKHVENISYKVEKKVNIESSDWYKLWSKHGRPNIVIQTIR